MSTDATQHSVTGRWGRRMGWTLLAVLLAGVLLRLSLRMTMVHNWVRNYLVSTANRQLTAELSIDRLSGDLWKEATLTGIRLGRQDTVASVDSVHVRYDIWSLLGGQIDVPKIGVYQPRLHLRQQENRWNVQDLVKESADTSATGGIAAFQVDSLELTGGHITVRSDSLPLESNFAVNNLAISSKVAYTNTFSVDLHELSFQLNNTRLDQPLRVQTSARARQNKITLEQLVAATGHSLVRSTGYLSSPDSSVRLDFSADPVGWQDMARYARDFPLHQNVQFDIALEGKPEQFTLSLQADAIGLDSLSIRSRFQWRSSSLVLQQLSVSASYLDLEELLADPTLPSLRKLHSEFNGRIDLADYQQGKGELNLSASNIARDAYHLDRVSAKGTLDGSRARLQFDAQQQRQSLSSEVWLSRLWDSLPSVEATIQGRHIDPSVWLQDTSYVGDLSFRSEISGRGWYPQKSPWQYSLTLRNSRVMGQSIASFSARGKLNRNEGQVDARLQLQDGVVDLKATLQNLMKTPSYDYQLRTQKLDLGPLLGRSNFKTALNSRLTGQGRGFEPAKMQMTTSLNVDSSLVNNELVSRLSADLSIRDSVAVVDSASLKSTIADGGFSLRLNMIRRYDSHNQLSFNMNLKELGALAPLAGVKDLAAEGTIDGKLKPVEGADLHFLGTLDLSNVKYNALFSVDRARGSVEVRTAQQLNYLADLTLDSPSFSGIQLRNLTLMTEGSYADSAASGKFEFNVSSPNEGRIQQGGTYALHPDSVRVRTTEFNIISNYRTLRLERPFVLSVRNDSLQMDTMRVSSGDGAFLEIGVPIATEKVQRGFVRGRELNTAVMQSCLLGEEYFRGMLSGRFEMARRDTSLNAEGQLVLSEVHYHEADFDSLALRGQIKGERMQGTLSLRHEGNELVTGNLNLPFKLGDPEKLPDVFFMEPVAGAIRVRDIAIDRFESLFAEAGLTQTSGIFSLRGKLSGTAGEPEFTANAALKKAKLSGVAVDSVTAGLLYRHEQEDLQLNGSVMSLHQKAAQINAQVPLFINMRNFRVDLPQARDSIGVDITTNSFNLQALNDFLDRLTIRQVAGQLDGAVHISGPIENPVTNGQLTLKNGAVRLVPAGIRIDHIRSTLKFDPHRLQLSDFSARSGKGSLSASGMIAMKKLVPGDLDIQVSAKNFRAANTAQYNAVLDLDARAQGSITSPKVTGSLSFISGFLKLQNFGEKSVENVQLDSTEEQSSAFSIYDSLALDMDVNFNRRFYIRNERYLEMEIELDGQLDLQKNVGKDLQLFGTMNAPSGYARPFGKEFKLQEGAVTFSGPPSNPQLNIRTRYEPPQTQQDIVIWYIIEGTVEKPKFKYESQPPMELENIISYTLFGQPFYALNSWKQVVASSGQNTTAANVALDILLDRVEALATQKLGIDVVKIDNTRVGGQTGTSITTGWYLNPKVFFAIQNVISGSTPDTSFLLEYLLRKNLKLILQQGNGIRQGVDVKWNYDY